MRILLCIFSGTGNTRKVGAFFADVLRGLGHEADVALIREDVPMPAIEGYDTLVIGYPVHAFNAPKPVLAFLKRLPKAQKPVYLLRTSGEPSKINDASGISPKRILKKKGYDVRGEFAYVMPYNIIFRHSDKMAMRMWKAALCKIPKDAALLAEGGTSLRKVGPLRRTAAAVVRIEHPAMPILGRTFRVNRKKCVGCAACGASSRTNSKISRRALRGVHGVRVRLPRGCGAHLSSQPLAGERAVLLRGRARRRRRGLPLLPQDVSQLLPHCGGWGAALRQQSRKRKRKVRKRENRSAELLHGDRRPRFSFCVCGVFAPLFLHKKIPLAHIVRRRIL